MKHDFLPGDYVLFIGAVQDWYLFVISCYKENHQDVRVYVMWPDRRTSWLRPHQIHEVVSRPK